MTTKPMTMTHEWEAAAILATAGTLTHAEREEMIARLARAFRAEAAATAPLSNERITGHIVLYIKGKTTEPMGETAPQDFALLRRSWATIYPTREAAEEAVRATGKKFPEAAKGVVFRFVPVAVPGVDLLRESGNVASF